VLIIRLMSVSGVTLTVPAGGVGVGVGVGVGAGGGGGGGGGGTGTVELVLLSPQPVRITGKSTTADAKVREPSDFSSHLCIVPFIFLLLTKKVGFG
jgi:hypothetical protein